MLKTKKRWILGILLISVISLGFFKLTTSTALAASNNEFQYCPTTNNSSACSNDGGNIVELEPSMCSVCETAFSLSGSSGNIATWSSPGPGPETITVNVCSPNQGMLKNPGSKPQAIKINGNYTNFVNNSTTPPPTCSSQQENQPIKVNLNFTGIPDGPGPFGPASIELKNLNGSTIKTTNTDTNPAGEWSNNITLTGTFKNISPGYYEVCTTSMTPPQCTGKTAITPAKFVNEITVNLTGNPSGAMKASIMNPPGATSSSNTGGTPACEGGGTLDWIWCAIYNSFNGITETVLKDFIMPELKINPVCISSSGSNCEKNDPTFQIWSSFRVYGDIILIISLLVIIISEAMGGGLMDAYTVRKMLPRILVAAILINLSIYIIAGLVDISNIIGGGIGSLITAPLKKSGAFVVHPDGAVAAGALAVVGVVGLLSISHMSSLFSKEGGSFLLDCIIIPVLLIILSILLTVIIRKIIILALIIMAPLAFAFYCLPNTEKYFKKWWSLLMEMLMVYPIILIIFALSSVMSVLSNSNPLQQPSGIGNAVDSILTLSFTLLPLLLIPFSFKLASDTIGRVHAAIEGQRTRVEKMREGRKKEATAKYQTRVVSNRANRYRRLEKWGVGERVSRVPLLGGRYNRGIAKAEQSAKLAAAALAQTPGAKATEHEDEVNRVATYRNGREAKAALTTEYYQNELDKLSSEVSSGGMTQAEAERLAEKNAELALNRVISQVQTSIGFGKVQAIHAARQRGVTGTGFKDPADQVATIERVAGGSKTISSALSGDLNSIAKQVNRFDLAPGFANLINLVDLQSKVSNAKSEGERSAAQDRLTDALSLAAEQGWNSASIYQHSVAKPQDIIAAIAHYTPMLKSPDTNQQDKAIVFYKELEAIKHSGTGEVANLASDALERYSGDYKQAENSTKTIVRNEYGGETYDIQTHEPIRQESARSIRNTRRARVYNPEEERLRHMSSGSSGTGSVGGGGPLPGTSH